MFYYADYFLPDSNVIPTINDDDNIVGLTFKKFLKVTLRYGLCRHFQ